MTDCSRTGAGQGDGSGARCEQIVFSFGEDVRPALKSDAAPVTADAGLAPLRDLDERVGLTALAAAQVTTAPMIRAVAAAPTAEAKTNSVELIRR